MCIYYRIDELTPTQHYAVCLPLYRKGRCNYRPVKQTRISLEVNAWVLTTGGVMTVLNNSVLPDRCLYCWTWPAVTAIQGVGRCARRRLAVGGYPFWP